MANGSRPRAQPSAVSRTAVGDFIVSVVNDGIFQISFDDIIGVDRAAAEASQLGEFRAVPPWLTINTFLIETPDNRRLLVDAGFGDETPLLGRLLPNLASVGIEPADIDAILMTHMHPDHEAGLIDHDGRAVFPNAELLVHEDDVAFWMNEAAYSQATETVQRYFRLARTALQAYRGRITLVRADQEPVPGVHVYPTPGHTPGHTAWHVHSGGDSLLIWGDVVHLPGVQLALPDAGVAFDIDYQAAAVTRKRVLDMVASEGMRVAAFTSTTRHSGGSSGEGTPMAICRRSGSRRCDQIRELWRAAMTVAVTELPPALSSKLMMRFLRLSRTNMQLLTPIPHLTGSPRNRPLESSSILHRNIFCGGSIRLLRL
jgi:glyoxylase-like metal-dependent hydrolase (beta-lactamase superfamily II)